MYFLYFCIIFFSNASQMDDFYCLIRLQKNRTISLCLFESIQNNIKNYNKNVYPICFTAVSADSMYILLSKHDLVKKLSMNHVLYIGQELYKAELSVIFDQSYVQN
uniref:DUF4346 domain-containing protein n=1 Tax=Phyllymenia taiwanensis TaxID=1260292 RepID=R9XXV2_9FLOR|nr:hypothetical protein [Grateloupia taiwanensis]AGO19819.1 hypothetical protein [Grateloupia taiwanensis]